MTFGSQRMNLLNLLNLIGRCERHMRTKCLDVKCAGGGRVRAASGGRSG